MESKLVVLASRQFGLVTRTQALSAGLTPRSIEWQLESAAWQRVHRRVYRFASHARSWEQVALAACLANDGTFALSHRTAGFVHRLDGLSRPVELDVLSPLGLRARLPGVISHETRGHFDIVHLHGLPVTNLARTVLDLASVLDGDAFERALDSAQRQRPHLGPWLGYVMKELGMRGPPGIARVKELLTVRLGITDSSLESDVTRALRRAGLPEWKHQHHVVDDTGAIIIRADFAWPRHRVVLHADSFNWHRHRHQFDRDRAQRNALRDAGWEELVVTNTSLDDERWLHQLERLLINRSPQRALFTEPSHSRRRQP